MSRVEIALRSLVAGLLLFVTWLAGLGCRQEMYDQPRYKPLAASRFFDDGRSARPAVEGTVARDDPVGERPRPALSMELLERGRERYDIYCSPCHDRTGFGRGMIVRRGFPAPPSYHDPERAALSPEEIVAVIDRGFGAMFPYGSRVPPDDRWAIAYYVKALQLSQRATVANLDPEERRELEEMPR